LLFEEKEQMKDEDNKMKDFSSERESLCRDLIELIQAKSKMLTGLGFSRKWRVLIV